MALCEKFALIFSNLQISLNLQTPKGTCAESVKTAIDAGYRHIDGAFVYHNEDEVGQAIREKIAEGKIKREDIFYCGKVRRLSPFLSLE